MFLFPPQRLRPRIEPICVPVRSLPRADVFLARIEELRRWLLERQEKAILLVSHWGVIEALTSDEFENCEVRLRVFARRAPACSLLLLS